MKYHLFTKNLAVIIIGLLIAIPMQAGKIEINEQNFPDENFRNWVLSQEYGKDGVLTEEEIAGATFVNLLAQNIIAKGNIHGLKGIEHFTAMTKLVCSRNELTELDLSKNTALTWLECYGNHLTELDLSKNTKLTHLDCQSNELTALNVSGCTHLTELDCFGNQLTTLNVSGCSALTILKCYLNPLMELDVSGCTSLTTMWVFDNQLRVLDVSDCNSLSNLRCDNNLLTELDVSKNTMLTELRCEDNYLTALDLSKNKNLNSLRTYHNPIKGEAMDILIESLPTVSRGDWSVVLNEDEEDVVTITQVAAAKAKGWNSCYWNEDAKSWMAYAGSKMDYDDQKEPNDYIPFVEMNKAWDEVISYDGPYYGGSISSFAMEEEVERDGKSYVHARRYLPAVCEVQEGGLFREENRRVYNYDEKVGRDIMMYDFSLKEGDTFTYEFDLDQPVNCKVLKQGWLTEGPQIATSCTINSGDSLDIKYRYLRTWTIGRDNGSGVYDEMVTWVEGIGALENMFGLMDNGIRKFDYSLAFVVRKDKETGYDINTYLPFSFCDKFMHGCNLPTGKENEIENDKHHKLTYELEGDRLHIYGDVFTQCGPNNYAYFYEEPTDDPLVHIIAFQPKEVLPVADCMALHATNFYVPGFDPNFDYIVIDNQGVEHPVINKTPQMAYRPFIEEGKVWKVGTISGNPVQVVDHYYFDGETIIDGKTCRQMMCQRYVSPDFSDDYWTPEPSLTKVGAWYEENQKVYFYDEERQSMRLMYDFSLNASDTLRIDDISYVIRSKQTGGLEGFKGVYRDIVSWVDGIPYNNTTWLEGVGDINGPTRNPCNPILGDPVPEFLMSCTVGDEVIYLNDEYEDGATPEAAGARKNHFDFSHTIKTKPKAPRRSSEESSLYGEYNDQRLGINLNPLDDAYLVRITDESGKVVYEKAVNAGNIVGLNVDISAYEKGRYTVTVENSNEAFTGQFDAQITGIKTITNNKVESRPSIYNLHGQRLSSLQKGLNIVNGQKIFVK